MLVIAHRGLPRRFPENSVQGIAAALEAGVNGVEFDVVASAAGQPVVVHQDIEAVSGEGRPHLREVLGLAWKGIVAYVELKVPTPDEQLFTRRESKAAERVVELALPLLREFTAGGGQVFILSFDRYALELCKAQAPEIPRMLNLWRDAGSQRAQVLKVAAELGLSAVGMPEQLALAGNSWPKALQAAGVKAIVFESSSETRDMSDEQALALRKPRWGKLLASRVDGVITDFAVELKAAIM